MTPVVTCSNVAPIFLASPPLQSRYRGRRKIRTFRLERQLRAALACDGLTDEWRLGVLRALYGKQGTVRAMISEADTKLLEDYRALDAAERQMLRTLIDRLARLHALAEDQA
jgi:hypothetical protein